MRVAVVVGTRPEIIKMTPVVRALQKYPDVTLYFIHSGQHYDEYMSDIFLRELELPEPVNLGVGSGSQEEQTARILAGCEKVFQKCRPDLVLSEGDTNTTLASALASAKMHIPYGHVEAGLRCFDQRMPEELNRIIADHLATLCFAPTERSALNLVFESIPPGRIFITGNTIVDAVTLCMKIATKKSNVLERLGISNEKIILLTLHRAENTDDLKRLQGILSGISKVEGCKIIFPVHPRTRKILLSSKLWRYVESSKQILHIDPVGYVDFIFLLSRSLLVLTDSGGVQEEAICLKVPCLTLRYSTERPETVEAGANILVNDDAKAIVRLTHKILEDKKFRAKMISANNPYGNGHAGERIARICVEKFHAGDIQYESPAFLRSGSGSYHLVDARNSKIDRSKIFCYFNQKGKPIFPNKLIYPKSKWKALVLKGG